MLLAPKFQYRRSLITGAGVFFLLPLRVGGLLRLETNLTQRYDDADVAK